MSKVTILLETTTRDELKAIGRKSQTYDQRYTSLIEEYRHGQQQQQQQQQQQVAGSGDGE